MLSFRVASACNGNSHSLGLVRLGPVTFGSVRSGSARLGSACSMNEALTVHHQVLKVNRGKLRCTIQIIQPTGCSSFTSLLLDVYVSLSMFRASPRPLSGAYNCTRSLWFLPLERSGWSVVGRGLAGENVASC